MRLILAFLAALSLALPLHAQEDLWPPIPKATGEPHPEGNDYWRKNHMVLLLHDREEALRKGDRDIKASLATCFDCHAVNDEAGDPVSFEDPRHFCRVCHDYAAVQVDCFTCHRSTPSDNPAGRLMAKPEEPDSIAAYLERLRSGQATQTGAGQ